MARWYREDLENGCATLPQRGIGKVYREVFSSEELKRRKAVWDPEGQLNPGNGSV